MGILKASRGGMLFGYKIQRRMRDIGNDGNTGHFENRQYNFADALENQINHTYENISSQNNFNLSKNLPIFTSMTLRHQPMLPTHIQLHWTCF